MNPQSAPSAKFPASSLPQSEEEVLAWLRLSRSRRVGPATFIRLIRKHANAASALYALPEIAASAGAKGYAPFSRQQAEAELQAGFKAGAELLCLCGPGYPPYLSLISDPPPLLWAIGNPALAARPAIGLVGARNASSLGQRMARTLASELGEKGYVIASGLARGVDTAAHHAALASGTIAVLAGGVDTVYPKENKALWQKIADTGLLLSEAPIGSSPQARHFPKRNRIISGISRGIVVIEGAAKSGSLITARNALDQGREVMAVPGSPLDPRASGCNMLLRDGAGLVRSGADVIEYLENAPRQTLALYGTPGQPASGPSPSVQAYKEPASPHSPLITLLSNAPLSEDILIRESGLPTPKAMEQIFELELAGDITRHPGGMLSLTK